MHHWLEADRPTLQAFLAHHGQPAYRCDQLVDWLHRQRVDDTAAMRNLPRALRDALDRQGRIRLLTERTRRDAADGLTAKWLFAAPSGSGPPDLLESVLIIERERRRRTACVSSMIGCPLDCAFCATGRHGFVRNLTAGEIIEQAYRIDAWTRTQGSGHGITHVVFMGMGEPLLNLEPVLRAAAVLTDAAGLGLSRRHLTISTAGVPDGIRRLAAAGGGYRLAVSLHAPTQRLRERIMPAARRWPLEALFPAIDEFSRTASRDVTYEYCLIDGVNAAPSQARELAALLRGRRGKVNLIPLNPVPGVRFQPPGSRTVRAFQDILQAEGIAATLRTEKGAGIDAACGQLRADAGAPGTGGGTA
ncbi:MAG: 23S rRNA (adenine(2503)-C(2))-methyltransferase RlmN [Planctomycetes bacterium]|nr:23S rRNA (adenine(2503)-C(2))-methyltransferase RlmN [Planctomycetota bacterium]